MNIPINDGGPAFPHFKFSENGKVEICPQGGMTLRDYFAGQALAGSRAKDDEYSYQWRNAKGEKKFLGAGSTPAAKDVEGWVLIKTSNQVRAESMYAIADAMLAARKEASK